MGGDAIYFCECADDCENIKYPIYTYMSNIYFTNKKYNVQVILYSDASLSTRVMFWNPQGIPKSADTEINGKIHLKTHLQVYCSCIVALECSEINKQSPNWRPLPPWKVFLEWLALAVLLGTLVKTLRTTPRSLCDQLLLGLLPQHVSHWEFCGEVAGRDDPWRL